MKEEKPDCISILKSIPGFAALAPDHLEKIAAIVNIQEYPYGDFVFKESDVSDAFYVILEGKVKIFVTDKENEDMTVSVFDPMDSFGEIGFISGNPRVASARVEKDSKLLVIKKYVFDMITEHDPSLTRCLINTQASLVDCPHPRLNVNIITNTVFMPLVLNTLLFNGCISNSLLSKQYELGFFTVI